MKKLCNRTVIAKSSTVSPALPQAPWLFRHQMKMCLPSSGPALSSVLCQTLAS